MLLPVTKRWDLMLGVDIHLNEWAIPTGHIVGATLNWVNNTSFSPNVFVNNQPVAYFFHDIKMLIPHIPMGSNLLVPIIMLLSNSKILLGAHMVRVNFKAIGVGPWPMLNCNFPCPLPTGFLIQFTDVFADIKLMDILMALAIIIFAMLPLWLQLLLVLILLIVVIDAIQDAVEEAQEKAQEAMDQAQQKFEEALADIQEQLQQIKDNLPSPPSPPSIPKPDGPDGSRLEDREPKPRPWDDIDIPNDGFTGWIGSGASNPMGRRLVQSIVTNAIKRRIMAPRFPEGLIPPSLTVPGGLLDPESMSESFAEKWQSTDWRLAPLAKKMTGLEEIVPQALVANEQAIGTLAARILEEMAANQEDDGPRAAAAQYAAQSLMGQISDSVDIDSVMDKQPDDVRSELESIRKELGQAVTDELRARPEAAQAGFEAPTDAANEDAVPRPVETEADREADALLNNAEAMQKKVGDELRAQAKSRAEAARAAGEDVAEPKPVAKQAADDPESEPPLTFLTRKKPGEEEDKWDGEDLWDTLDDEELHNEGKAKEASDFARGVAQGSFEQAQQQTGKKLGPGSSREDIEAVMEVYLEQVARAAVTQTKSDSFANGTRVMGGHFGSSTAQQVRLEGEIRGVESSAVRETTKAMMPTAVRMVDGYLNPKKAQPVGTPVTHADFSPKPA